MKPLYHFLVLLFALTHICYAQIIETESKIEIKYPFHYTGMPNSTLMVYDDTLFEHLPKDNAFLEVNVYLTNASGKEYSEELNVSKLDTINFYYPGSKTIYYQLIITEAKAVIRFFNISGQIKNELGLDRKKGYKFIVTYNRTWHSPPYPVYDYLTVLKP